MRSDKMGRLPVIIVVTFIALAVSAHACPPPGSGRPTESLSQENHPDPDTLPAGSPVCARGRVESTRRQTDRDVHVWVCSRLPDRSSAPHYTMDGRRAECVLGEVTPDHSVRHPRDLPPIPRVGTVVEVCGTWVPVDLHHKWTEIHPVTEWRLVE